MLESLLRVQLPAALALRELLGAAHPARGGATPIELCQQILVCHSSTPQAPSVIGAMLDGSDFFTRSSTRVSFGRSGLSTVADELLVRSNPAVMTAAWTSRRTP
jgi:hypothetical protein